MASDPPALVDDGAGDWTPAGLVTPYPPEVWEQIKANAGPAPVLRHGKTWAGIRAWNIADSAHPWDDFSGYRFPRLQKFLTKWVY